MTPDGTTDADADAFDTLLRAIASGRVRADEPEARQEAARLFGRPDALELIREALVEDQLCSRLRAEIGGGSVQGTNADRSAAPMALHIPLLVGSGVGSRSRRPSRRLVLAAAAVLVAAVGLSWNAASGLLQRIRADGAVESRTVATRAAQLDTVNLPDGSRAILAPNSSLRYSMGALEGPRELQLQGEALFDVKHDDKRPFRVRTRRTVVEDLGTSFVVREYAGDLRARVTVRSGAAALHAGDGSSASPIDLRPGDGAYVDSSGAIARFSGDPESFGAWTAGYLTFDGVRLPEVLSQLERWYGVEFRMTDSTLTKQHFTGGLSSTSLPKALDILGPIVHARFAQEGRVVKVTARPEGR